MRRSFSIFALLLSAIALFAPTHAAVAAPAAQPANAKLSADMNRIVELVNLRRREAGLAPVVVHGTLMACAQQYSDVQASQGALNHTGPDGSTPGQRLSRCGYRWKHFGENLAAGFTNPDELVAAWMASPGHRKNILNRKVVEIGLGYAHRSDDPARYYDYYVMEVGIRR
jgi:uncharacterized protein YkwD